MILDKSRHHGVGIVITNKKRNLFYIQQKDKHYPINKFKLGYSFFGGGVNKGENEKAAIKRELHEELGKSVANIISPYIRKIDNFELTSNKRLFNFTLYEAILSDKELIKISKLHVNEGRGVLVQRSRLTRLKFIYSLEVVLKKYLKVLYTNKKNK